MPPEKTLRQLAGWLGLLGVAVGTVALIGWRLHADPLGVLPLNGAPMKPGAALCLALVGASLWLQLRTSNRAQSVGLGCAAFVVLISAASLAQKWFGLDLGVDRLFAPPGEASGTRMSTHTAMVLGTIAVAHVFLRQPRTQRALSVSAWLSNLVIAVCAAGLLAGEFATTPDVTRPLRFSSHLSVALLLLGCGTRLARPDDRQLKILFAHSSAGLLARRLLLGIALVPVGLSAMLALLVQHDLVTLADGVLLFVAAIVLSGFGVALFSIEAAARVQESRDESEQARLILTTRLQQQAAQLQDAVAQQTRELSVANESLRLAGESNARLALVAQHTTNGVMITTSEGRIEWVNDAFTRLTGYTLDEARGRKPGHLLQGPDTSPESIAALRSAEQNGEPCTVEILNYTKTRTRFWQLVDVQPIRDAAGRVVNFIAIQTDITDQRATRTQLEQLNERLRLALRSSNYGVWEHDLIEERRFWDDQVLEMYGIARREFDPSRPMWLERMHPDDRDQATEHLRRLLAGEIREYDLAFRIVRPDGSVRHLDSHAYLQRDPGGQPLRLVGLARDVTEQKQLAQALELAEQRWQLAVEATNDSVWDWDMVAGRIFHDRRLADFLGYAPDEMEDTITAWKALVHSDDLAVTETLLREHFEQRTPFYQCELRVRTKNGDWRWLLHRGKVVRRATDGRPLRMAGTHTDITTRKELEQRLRKSDELAAEVSRLAQIGGWEIDMLTSRVTWSDGTRLIHEVDAHFQPTLETVWQFFPTDALDTVHAAINEAKPSAPAFDLEVSLLTARGNRRWVRILGRAEFNHGRIATVHGAIQDVTAQHESMEARRQLETQLFQSQKLETLGTLVSGMAHDFNNLLTGIVGYHELAVEALTADHPARLCLLEARNASLRARELVDQILTLGRASQRGSADDSSAKIADTTARARGEFICVVDDEEVVGTCTKLVLEHKGYRSLVFTSAEKCLAEIRSNPGHCRMVITDQTMPGMKGTELAKSLRHVAPDLPIVIMSGYFPNVSARELHELGQIELLAKPFTTDELLHAVQRATQPIAKAG